MIRVLACVDGSNYDASVCEHAAWLAGRMGGRVLVLHACEQAAAGAPDDPAPYAILEAALHHLHDHGVEGAEAELADGDLVDAILAADAQAAVIGKRGRGAQVETRAGTGSQVESVLRRTTAPTCLASQYFLPVNRALVLLDADPNRRDAVEFIAENDELRGLDINLVIANDGADPPEAKLQWARQTLSAEEARIFSIRAEGLGAAVGQYLESRRLDLLILSRAVLLPPEDDGAQRLEARGLWAFRAPVLVC